MLRTTHLELRLWQPYGVLHSAMEKLWHCGVAEKVDSFLKNPKKSCMVFFTRPENRPKRVKILIKQY